MKTITDTDIIIDLMDNFSQTIIEDGSNGETIEHGHLDLGGDDETTARCIYRLPADGSFDSESVEFLGDWNDHIVGLEIDEELA